MQVGNGSFEMRMLFRWLFINSRMHGFQLLVGHSAWNEWLHTYTLSMVRCNLRFSVFLFSSHLRFNGH
jgi:hypothetical protein